MNMNNSKKYTAFLKFTWQPHIDSLDLYVGMMIPYNLNLK